MLREDRRILTLAERLLYMYMACNTADDIVCSARKFFRNFFRGSGFALPVVKFACRLPRRWAESHTPGTSEAVRAEPPPNFFLYIPHLIHGYPAAFLCVRARYA